MTKDLILEKLAQFPIEVLVHTLDHAESLYKDYLLLKRMGAFDEMDMIDPLKMPEPYLPKVPRTDFYSICETCKHSIYGHLGIQCMHCDGDRSSSWCEYEVDKK